MRFAVGNALYHYVIGGRRYRIKDLDHLICLLKKLGLLCWASAASLVGQDKAGTADDETGGVDLPRDFVPVPRGARGGEAGGEVATAAAAARARGDALSPKEETKLAQLAAAGALGGCGREALGRCAAHPLGRSPRRGA